MEYRDFYERIDKITDIEAIAKKVCSHYNIGEYITYDIEPLGYEDFNFLLTTDKNKYYVKILNTERTDFEKSRYASVMRKAYEFNIDIPQLYQMNGKNNRSV